MAEFLVAFLTWVVSAIVRKLLTDASVYYRSIDMVDEFQKLETTILPEFDLVIQAAEKNPHRGKLEAWLRRFREALYDVKNLLDEHNKYNMLKRKAKSGKDPLVGEDETSSIASITLKPLHAAKSKARNLSEKRKLINKIEELKGILLEGKELYELLGIPHGNIAECRQQNELRRRSTQHPDTEDHESLHLLWIDLEANYIKPLKPLYALIHFGYTVFKLHCIAADDQMEEQQKRCYEYSKKALAFEGCILAAYFLSPVASSTRRATLFITMATLFISLDKAYGYAFIFFPVLIFVSIGVAFFQHKQQLRGVDEAVEDHLNQIFDFSALILNWGALITAILCYNMEAKHSAPSITGFLFIFTVILSLYLMMVTTLRDVALARLAIYLDYSLAAMLFATLIATIISFITGKKT